ncbi:methyltransferase [Brachybacterium phenoliresistens]|uniref:Methyltransferase n=1 Tax=Brachybacterium phenoliresistens TaxID=396014 RepID=Z9JVD9_9MICO|nr:class I SAM-dependent methyltransferase [Brachybacterium phenoliresistens]EWS82149.1 methyltransferase [Brachybacterium phenoliresistens]
MSDDLYTANAEWYAALVAPWQESTASALRSALGPLQGDVVDIASGVGTALPVLRELGAARLFAVEPSASMRAGLMTTIAGDPTLMRDTTVVPSGVPEALDRLPPRWDAAVMLNAIGHLDDDARMHLWAALGGRLRPGGRFALSLQPPGTVTAIPWTDFGEVAIGENRIRTRGRADPLDGTRVTWTMEWSLLDAHGDLLERRRASYPWRALSREVLVREAAARGLRAVGPAPDSPLLALERAG